VKDGWVTLESDGAGGTLLGFDHDGPTGSSPVWPNRIIDIEHVSPTGLTWAQLEGPGLNLVATTSSSVLTGGLANDTLSASDGLDTLTGGAGGDHFVFTKEPWAPVHITDFQPGADVLDLSALFKQYGYAGTDPVADGWVTFESDGNGGTLVGFDHDGPTGSSPVWPNRIIDLENVSPTGLTWAQVESGWVAA
jgi:Ca2+-binding RTX toxin-like protein